MIEELSYNNVTYCSFAPDAVFLELKEHRSYVFGPYYLVSMLSRKQVLLLSTPKEC